MNVIPFVHEGLGNSSYLVETLGGGAIAVDPDRTVARYLRAAEARGRRITHVLDTHLHADFVSGAREIAQALGATLLEPAGAQLRLPHRAVAGGERIAIEGIEIDALATPGHTPEHLSYVLRNAGGARALFSGGALLVGGAARTDLVAPELTEPLTRAQFRTLRTAFSALPDETALYPTHGGGSFCSAGGGGERTSTLGEQRRSNPLLSMTDEDEFARWFPTTFPGVPDYFFRMRAVNQAGPRLRTEIALPRPLTPAEFAAQSRSGVVIDARPVDAYLAAHVAGAISNAFRSSFAVWLGWLVPAGARLFFVADRADVDALIDESLLVGYENFGGLLAGGMEAWTAAGLPVNATTAVDARAADDARRAGALVLDVRERDEYASGHIEGALHIPLGELDERAVELPAGRPIVAYCGHGERSTTAASLLERAGRGPVLNLEGGYDAWARAAARR